MPVLAMHSISRDIWRPVVSPPEWLRELNLDISTEESQPERAFTYADLYADKDGETAAQLTPQIR
jgi:hypothetical protein